MHARGNQFIDLYMCLMEVADVHDRFWRVRSDSDSICVLRALCILIFPKESHAGIGSFHSIAENQVNWYRWRSMPLLDVIMCVLLVSKKKKPPYCGRLSTLVVVSPTISAPKVFIVKTLFSSISIHSLFVQVTALRSMVLLLLCFVWH